MRILVAFEDDYRIYRDVIAASIRLLRPRAEVETAGLEALGEHIKRFEPELVICTRSNSLDPSGRLAWVERPVHPTRPTKIYVGGRYSERTNPTLDMLLEVIDEVEELLLTNSEPRSRQALP
jgi:hypothetical protein